MRAHAPVVQPSASAAPQRPRAVPERSCVAPERSCAAPERSAAGLATRPDAPNRLSAFKNRTPAALDTETLAGRAFPDLAAREPTAPCRVTKSTEAGEASVHRRLAWRRDARCTSPTSPAWTDTAAGGELSNEGFEPVKAFAELCDLSILLLDNLVQSLNCS